MNRQEFERRQGKVVSSVIVSDLRDIDPFLPISNLRINDIVITASRVSRRQQKSHLKDQQRNLKQRVMKIGAYVKSSISYIGSGCDPSWLKEARDEARKFKQIGEQQIYILAETKDRFIRSGTYHSIYNPTAQANEEEIKKLLDITQEIPLMVLDIDQSHSNQRSTQVKRGITKSKKRPGYKTNQKQSYLPIAVKMKHQGSSLQDIADFISIESGFTIHKSTIGDWIRSYSSSSNKIDLQNETSSNRTSSL